MNQQEGSKDSNTESPERFDLTKSAVEVPLITGLPYQPQGCNDLRSVPVYINKDGKESKNGTLVDRKPHEKLGVIFTGPTGTMEDMFYIPEQFEFDELMEKSAEVLREFRPYVSVPRMTRWLVPLTKVELQYIVEDYKKEKVKWYGDNCNYIDKCFPLRTHQAACLRKMKPGVPALPWNGDCSADFTKYCEKATEIDSVFDYEVSLVQRIYFSITIIDNGDDDKYECLCPVCIAPVFEIERATKQSASTVGLDGNANRIKSIQPSNIA